MRIIRQWGQYFLPGTAKKQPSGISKVSKRFWLTWMLGVSVILLSGSLYRVQYERLHRDEELSAVPSVELRALPLRIGDWTGRDIPLREDVRRAAKVDDSLSRLYVRSSGSQWAQVYIAFSTRPGNMVGHRPEVCYVSSGWILDGALSSSFKSVAGREFPCRIHVFRKPLPYDQTIVVLNYYVVNGKLVCSEEEFSGLEWRVADMGATRTRCVSQIQISSVLENSARSFAEAAAESILGLLPDEHGQIRISAGSGLDGPAVAL